MSNVEHMIFSENELIAIHTALNIQIETCEEYLATLNLTIPEKVKLNESIKYSKSALYRLEKIFRENDIQPLKS